MKTNKKTEAALSSLDWAISQTIKKPRDADEFTLADFSLAGGISRGSAEAKIRRLISSGVLTKRPFSFGGSSCQLYRRA